MKEYVRLYFLDRPQQRFLNKFTGECLTLVSEVFTSQEEADYFANVFSWNYDCCAYVSAVSSDKFIVYAERVHNYRIQANYRYNEDCFIFANWKFEQRGGKGK